MDKNRSNPLPSKSLNLYIPLTFPRSTFLLSFNKTNPSRNNNSPLQILLPRKNGTPPLKFPYLKKKKGGKKKEKKRKIAKLVPVMFSSGYCDRCHPRDGERERIIRGNDPSFRLAATKKRGEKGARGKTAAKRGLRGRDEDGRDCSPQPREEKERGGGIRRLRVVIIINLSGI